MLEIKNKKFDIRLDVVLGNDRAKDKAEEEDARPALDIKLVCKNPFEKAGSTDSR